MNESEELNGHTRPRSCYEPVAETDGVSVGKEGAIGVFVCEGIHACGIRSVDGIVLHALLWGDPPAIVDAAEVSSERETLEQRRVTSRTIWARSFTSFYDVAQHF